MKLNGIRAPTKIQMNQNLLLGRVNITLYKIGSSFYLFLSTMSSSEREVFDSLILVFVSSKSDNSPSAI